MSAFTDHRYFSFSFSPLIYTIISACTSVCQIRGTPEDSQTCGLETAGQRLMTRYFILEEMAI